MKAWKAKPVTWRRKGMDILKRKRVIALFSSLTAMRLAGVVVSVVGVIALICTLACEQRAGVRPSGEAPAGKPVATAPSKIPTLTNAECVLCHPQQPQTIEARGGKHKTEVGCLDCHQEHPPQGTNAIPECSMCHSGKPHYDLERCSSCHADAHAPLDLKLEGDLTAACLTCHEQQGEEVKKHPSAHTDLACNECHAAHRQIPSCMDCHEKHTEDMDFQACLSCHPAHMPLVITYPQNTPSHWCGACHKKALTLLANNTTKHHNLSCAFCHRDKHKVIPPCFACHPNIHPQAILDKFPKCGECHGTAHDLKG
jgi:predicted CXXCH cytochrome family protein